MGGSHAVFVDRFDIGQWRQLQQTPSFAILQHTISRAHAQLYTLHFQQSQFLQRDLSLYKLRIEPLPNVVRLYAAYPQSGVQCGSTQITKVVVERIPELLSDSRFVGQETMFKMMEDALRGFEALNKRFHKSMVVVPSMIGLNEKKEVRVWLNQDFSKNLPDHGYGQGDRQHTIINSFFNAFQKKFQASKYPIHFAHLKDTLYTPYSFQEVRPMIQDFNRNYSLLNKPIQKPQYSSQPSPNRMIPQPPSHTQQSVIFESGSSMTAPPRSSLVPLPSTPRSFMN